MTKRRWQISRRAFLGGAATAVALPWMDAMFPTDLAAQEDAPLRMLAYYVPNGMHMASWTPAAEGSNYALSPILMPLAAVQDDIFVLSGLRNDPAKPDGPGDHASGTGAFISAAHPHKTEGADIRNGISIDQVAANALGGATRFPSIQLGIDGGGSVGGCDSGYSCAYARNISWASETQPLPKAVNPRVIFDRLFGGFDPTATAAEIEKRRKYHSSVLDYTRSSAQSLSLRLGARDRSKLDEYLTGVRELEIRVADVDPGVVCTSPGLPPVDYGLVEHIDLMTDLMLTAMQCDLTRYMTFMLANAGSGRSYAFLGVSGGHHEISHHMSDQGNFDKLEVIDRWEVEQFAKLVNGMAAINEGERTMLQNSMVFFSSEIEDGNSHRHSNMPIVLAGSAGGKWSPGRHIAFTDTPPVANLFVTMLEAAGVPTTSFGDSTGALSGLT